MGEKIKKFKVSSGVSMFFTFIKMAICLLIVRFLISDCFNIVTSLKDGNYCKQATDCEQTIFSYTSSLNKVFEFKTIQILDILNLVTIFLLIVFFLLYRKYQYKIYSTIDFTMQTQDDYSLFITNIPIIMKTSSKDLKFNY